jgi:hypothetical protein
MANLLLNLPPELQNKILDSTDPLTQYINNHGAYSHVHIDRNHQLAIDIWKAVFKQEWEGDLSILPRHLPNIHTGLRLVKTRTMYDRLCMEFPDDVWDYTTLPKVYLIKSEFFEWSNHWKPFVNYFGLIHVAIHHGWWWDMVNLRPRFHQCGKSPDLINYALAGVHRKLLEDLLSSGSDGSLRCRFLYGAILYGYHDHIRYCLENNEYNQDLYEVVMDAAVISGNIDTLKLVMMRPDGEGGYNTWDEWEESNLEAAAYLNHLEVFKFLVEQNPELMTHRTLREAIKGDSIDILAFIGEKWPDSFGQMYECKRMGKPDISDHVLQQAGITRK